MLSNCTVHKFRVSVVTCPSRLYTSLVFYLLVFCKYLVIAWKLYLTLPTIISFQKALEDHLAAEIIKYENDTLRMSTQLSIQQLQSQQQSQQLGNPASRHGSCSSSLEGDTDAASQVVV